MTVDMIRALNDTGIKAFQEFIEETRAAEKNGNPRLAPPLQLLADEAMTESVEIDLALDNSLSFENRFNMAAHLNTKLGPSFDDRLYDNAGLWAWLALFYFDQLRAVKGLTQRSEHFVPDEWSKQTLGQDLGYRHSVRTPLHLLRNYEEAFARFALTGRPVHQMGDIVEQVASRPKLLRSERLRATMLKLYQAKNSGAKRGSASAPSKNRNSDAGRGGLRRFANVYVPRIKLGFDIDEMEVVEIVTVCGTEISTSKFAKP